MFQLLPNIRSNRSQSFSPGAEVTRLLFSSCSIAAAFLKALMVAIFATKGSSSSYQGEKNSANSNTVSVFFWPLGSYKHKEDDTRNYTSKRRANLASLSSFSSAFFILEDSLPSHSHSLLREIFIHNKQNKLTCLRSCVLCTH